MCFFKAPFLSREIFLVKPLEWQGFLALKVLVILRRIRRISFVCLWRRSFATLKITERSSKHDEDFFVILSEAKNLPSGNIKSGDLSLRSKHDKKKLKMKDLGLKMTGSKCTSKGKLKKGSHQKMYFVWARGSCLSQEPKEKHKKTAWIVHFF